MSTAQNNTDTAKRMSDQKRVFAVFLMIGVLTMIAGAGVHNDDLVGVGGLVSFVAFNGFLWSS